MKVVLIPILSPAFDSDFAIQIALRSVAAFGNEARAEKWNAALGMIQININRALSWAKILGLFVAIDVAISYRL